MSARTDTEVIIGGKVLTVSGNESAEYLQKVASYINNKVNEYAKLDSYKRQSVEKQNMLVQLNIADDYFKAQEMADELKQQKEEIERDIYSLKHDLIDVRMENDRLTKQMEELETQLTEARKRQERVTRAASSGRRLYKPEQRL